MRRGVLLLAAAWLAATGCSIAHPVDGFSGGPLPVAAPSDAGPDAEPTTGDDAAPSTDTVPSPDAPPATSHYLYVIGGSVAENLFQDNVYYAEIQENGDLGPLEATTPLPTGLRNHTAIVHDDELYVVGGELTDGILSPAVFVTSIRPDGRLGTWKTIASSLGDGRKDHATVLSGDTLFLTGGFDGVLDDGARGPILRARVTRDGIGAWASAGSLPDQRLIHASVAHQGHLFTLGGSAGGPYSTEVLDYPIRDDGALGAVVKATPLPIALGYHRAVMHDDAILVVGGITDDGQTLTSAVLSSVVGRGGALGAWSKAQGFSGPRWRHAAAAFQGSVYVVGGREANGGPFLNDIQIARVKADRALEWRTSPRTLSRRLASHALVVH